MSVSLPTQDYSELQRQNTLLQQQVQSQEQTIIRLQSQVQKLSNESLSQTQKYQNNIARYEGLIQRAVGYRRQTVDELNGFRGESEKSSVGAKIASFAAFIALIGVVALRIKGGK